MGFGSYDEAEQQRQNENTDADEVEGVNVHANDHEGEVTFDSDASTDDLLNQLATIKESSE